MSVGRGDFAFSSEEGRDATNFSYVAWEDVADALGLSVSTAAGNDPRFR